MRIEDIPDLGIQSEALHFIQNLGILQDKLKKDWSRKNITAAAKWFQVVADEFTRLANHPDPFPGE